MNEPARLRQGWGEVVHRGRRISFRVQGTESARPPLVLLPSLGGGARHWGEFGRLLSADRQTVAVEPLGFGDSSPPPLRLSTLRLAQEVLFTLEAVKLQSWDLFGLSLGALLATQLALLAPERLHRLVLASCAARGRDFVPRRLATGLRLLSDFVVHARPKPAIARDIAVADGADPCDARADVGGAGWSRVRLLHFLAASAAHDVHAMLPRISAPVLVLHGERDAILSPASQQRLLAQLPRASYRELPGAGHDLVSEAPQSSAQLIAGFLSVGERNER